MKNNPHLSTFFIFISCIFIAVFTPGCLGGMVVRETHYFAVEDEKGKNTNYFRLKVAAKTVLSKAEYNSGYYSNESVDQLFGKVIADSDLDYIQLQRELNKLTNDKIYIAEKNWLEGVENNASETDQKILLANRTKILAYPNFEFATLTNPNGIIMEYNPALERVYRHIDQKQVFFLSSNPDEIMQDISNFAQSTETALQLRNIATALAKKNENNNLLEAAKFELDTMELSILFDQLKSVQSRIQSTTDHNTIVNEVSTLLKVLLK